MDDDLLDDGGMPERRDLPPTTFNVIKNAFRPAASFKGHKELHQRVQQLTSQGRFRSAMDKVFDVLADDPTDKEALSLAIIIASSSRTVNLQAMEPLTDVYLHDRRLDPIFAVCSHCKKTEWVPNFLLKALAAKVGVFNAMGMQCFHCGYVVCRDCFETSRLGAGTGIVSSRCPNCDQNALKAVVYPTGRQPRHMARHSGKVLRVYLFREGPVPLDQEYMAELLARCSPDALEDDADLTGIPLPSWPDNIDRFCQAYILAAENQEPDLQGSLDCSETARIDDRWGNSVYVVKRLDGRAGRTDPQVRDIGFLLWFNWAQISSGGHRCYGKYVYHALLPFFSPKRFDRPIGSYHFFDGDLIGPVSIPYSGPADARVLAEIQRIAEECYVVAVYASHGRVDCSEVDRAFRRTGVIGYVGMTSCPGLDFEQFYDLTGQMRLPYSAITHGKRFEKHDFGYVSDNDLEDLGFEIVPVALLDALPGKEYTAEQQQELGQWKSTKRVYECPICRETSPADEFEIDHLTKEVYCTCCGSRILNSPFRDTACEGMRSDSAQEFNPDPIDVSQEVEQTKASPLRSARPDPTAPLLADLLGDATLERLIDADFGSQMIPDLSAFKHDWFAEFKMHYDNKDAGLATAVLHREMQREPRDGLSWYWYALVEADLRANRHAALLVFLVGAKTCNRMKTGLLEEAAEQLLLEWHEVENATKLFFKALLSVTPSTKAWGDVSRIEYLNQERAFRFLEVLLECCGFPSFLHYIVVNVPMATHLESQYVQEIRQIVQRFGDPLRTRAIVNQMFPELRRKIEEFM